MATTPKPRSYFQILADMIDTFTARTEIERLKVGNPILTVLEAAAQSDVRSTQDYFAVLDSVSLDSAEGIDLDNIAAREGTQRIPAKSASGFVAFTDSRISKVSSSIYQGATAPSINTTALKVEDATLFPAAGQIYIGRGSSSYEGPLSYTSKTNNGAYWTLTLSGSGTNNFHNIGESVILAQNGTRIIQANTQVQVPQGVTDSIVFSTLNQVFIEDGEVTVSNVEIVAQQAGKFNIPARSISSVVSPTFPGIVVINSLALTNGLDVESDSDLRERIRNLRQSRVNGTATAIESAVLGASADGKTVVSSKIYKDGNKSTIYIDDGSGYEESFDGVAYEVLTNAALGGEQFFELSERPVAKAFLQSALSSPFGLVDGSILSVNVGGVITEHTFLDTQFTDISTASGYEVVASINGDPNLNFSAKTVNGGTQVIVFAKADTNEDVQIATPVGVSANNYLNFSTIKNYTLRLYKNDKLLFRDGSLARISSRPQGEWNATITSGDTLLISVDGTTTQTITILNSDFVNTNTGYSLVSAFNSLASWATVLNSKIAGVTVSISQNVLVITSNKGASNSAKVQILGGTLASKAMFTGLEVASGTQNDYSLNLNLSQIKLVTPLVTGDRLTVSTENTRAYLESTAFSSGSVTFGSNATFYIIVDGTPQIVPTSLTSAQNVAVTATGNVARYTTPFNNQFDSINLGDYFFNLTAGTDIGYWKVSNKAGAYFEVERTTITPGTFNFSNFAFIRSNTNIQQVTIPSGSYSLSALAALLQSGLSGVNVYVYKNTKIRISSNGFINSDIFLVDNNTSGNTLGLIKRSLVSNTVAQSGYVESQMSRVRTPRFIDYAYSTVGVGNFTVPTSKRSIIPTDGMYYERRFSDATTFRWGDQQRNIEQASDLTTAGTVTYRTGAFTNDKLVGDRFVPVSSVAISPRDTLTLVLDKNPETKTYNFNMFRDTAPAAAQSYGNANIDLTDTANGAVSLFNAFGSTTSFFEDFAVYMRARGKSHSTTANKSILFRNTRFGAEGEGVRVGFHHPQNENASLAFSSIRRKDYNVYNIHLPSGAARTLTSLLPTHRFVNQKNKTYAVVNATRVGTTVTVTLSNVTNVIAHLVEVGDVVFNQTNDANFPAGAKVVTSVTASAFTYTEAGAATSANLTFTHPSFNAGTTFTVTGIAFASNVVTATVASHKFKVGDTAFFGPTHWDSGASQTIRAGNYVVTATTATTVSWSDSTLTGSGSGALESGVTFGLSEGHAVRRKFVEASYGVEIGNMSRTNNIVTLFCGFNPMATSIGFVVGDIVYIDSADANFPAGYKVVSSVSGVNGQTLRYVEAGSNATNAVGVRALYQGTTMNLSPAVVGDVVRIDKDSGILGVREDKIARVASISSNTFSILEDNEETNVAVQGLPTAVGTAGFIKFYPITSTTASAIVTWVNSTIPTFLSAVAVPSNGSGSTTGAGTITVASQDEFFLRTTNASYDGAGSRSVDAFPLFDGVNSVGTCLIDPSNSKIKLKGLVSGELTSNADFSNEILKLAPVTISKIVGWINSTAVSSFFSNGTAYVSGKSGNISLSTNSLGSGGSVEVTGGSANSAVAITSSGASSVNIKIINGNNNLFPRTELGWTMEVPTDQISGFVGNETVTVANTIKTFKTLAPTSSPIVTITNLGNGVGNMVFTQLPLEYNTYQSLSGKSIQIETYAGFTKYKDTSASPNVIPFNAIPGSFVYIKIAGAADANVGIKKLVGVDAAEQCFWVEGVGADQFLSAGTADALNWIGYNSWAPGDQIISSGDILGPSNNGTFTILDYSFDGTNQITGINVSGLQAISSVNVPTITDIKVIEKDLLKMYGRISSVAMIDATTSRVMFKFNNQTGAYISNNLTANRPSAVEKLAEGAIITGLDKLSFSTNISEGLDGYKYNTGLLAEVNKILFGDESNSFIYKGVIASGTNNQLSGPLIKRVNVSFGIRTDSSNIADIIAKVKNAVATVINSSLAGKSISISKVSGAIASIEGVTSVVPLYPIYNDVNDFIKIQPYEKARILDLNTDVTITLLG